MRVLIGMLLCFCPMVAEASGWVITESRVKTRTVVTHPQVKRVERIRMRWNISGDWTPAESQTRGHLEREHGVSTDGMSHQQMLELHDSLHDGRRVPVRRIHVNVGTQWHSPSDCPGGVCPPVRRVFRVR